MDRKHYYLKRRFAEIYKKYPMYIKLKEAADICGVLDYTIHRWEKDGLLQYKRVIDGQKRYHLIYLDDVLWLLYIRDSLYIRDRNFKNYIKVCFSEKLDSYSDALSIKNITKVTGYSSTTILRWLDLKLLMGHKVNNMFFVCKSDLLEFLCNKTYNSIKLKSNEHQKIIQRFLELYVL